MSQQIQCPACGATRCWRGSGRGLLPPAYLCVNGHPFIDQGRDFKPELIPFRREVWEAHGAPLEMLNKAEATAEEES